MNKEQSESEPEAGLEAAAQNEVQLDLGDGRGDASVVLAVRIDGELVALAERSSPVKARIEGAIPPK